MDVPASTAGTFQLASLDTASLVYNNSFCTNVSNVSVAVGTWNTNYATAWGTGNNNYTTVWGTGNYSYYPYWTPVFVPLAPAQSPPRQPARRRPARPPRDANGQLDGVEDAWGTPPRPLFDEFAVWALTPAEREEIEREQGLTIPSLLPGRQYQIPHLEGGMVVVLVDGIPTKRLCLQPADNWLSNTRWLVLQMLMIRADERQYLRKAVHWTLDTGPIPDAYATQDRPQFARLAAYRYAQRRRARRLAREG